MAASDSHPPIRYPPGTPVTCFVGDNGWITGTVVKQNYREASWPEDMPTAPYQILLDDEFISGPGQANAIWAPADVDSIIRSNFRFALGAAAEVRVGQDDWCRCQVNGHLYREAAWPETQYAPYQVRVLSALPGSPIADKLTELAGDLIWVARDNADNIREVSEERWQRLQALADQREKGELGEEEYLEKRSTLIHDKAVE